ncbi:MAG: hypothetical protein LBI29_01485 [Rickettsiales bacterium]|jgi:hypothetical protein|nr:hypothetical protein [Rickettsiales bacterium]
MKPMCVEGLKREKREEEIMRRYLVGEKEKRALEQKHGWEVWGRSGDEHDAEYLCNNGIVDITKEDLRGPDLPNLFKILGLPQKPNEDIGVKYEGPFIWNVHTSKFIEVRYGMAELKYLNRRNGNEVGHFLGGFENNKVVYGRFTVSGWGNFFYCEGEFNSDGIPVGEGTMRKMSEGGRFTYEGLHIDGKENGKGRITDSNGFQYKCSFKNGVETLQSKTEYLRCRSLKFLGFGSVDRRLADIDHLNPSVFRRENYKRIEEEFDEIVYRNETKNMEF